MRRALRYIFAGVRRAAARGTSTTFKVVALAACALLLSIAFAPSARAATFIVTNTNDTGTGSLRRQVERANTAAGADIISFNIPPNMLTNGVAVITLTSGSLVFTDDDTYVNGATQTAARGDTNPGQLGLGGTVGVDSLILPRVNRPEVQVVDGAGVAVGFDISANNIRIRALSIYGFGTTANNNNSGNIRVNNFTGTFIDENILGASATSFTDPGAARSIGDNIRIVNGDLGIIQNNLIGYSSGKGIGIEDDADDWTVTGNELRGNAIGNSNLDGIDVENGSDSATIRGNLTTENEGVGFDTYQSTGSNVIENNTVTRNGRGPDAALIETPGVRLFGTGNVVQRNIINANYGAGVLVQYQSINNRISQNSIFANGTITNASGAAATGQIGIDLMSATDVVRTGTSPYVTLNDSGDGDGNANGMLNYPVITTAIISGGNLTLTGFARPTSAIELFIAAPDPRGFGEGQTYLVTLTEGTAADTDTGTGTYNGLVNGINVGTDTTNRFRFIIPAPAGVATGTTLTATATVGTNTSEFSGNIVVSLPPTLALAKCRQMGASCLNTVTAASPDTDVVYVINFSNTVGAPATNFVITDQIPTNTDFKIGTSTVTLGTTGLTVATTYSNDGGTTWTYTPVTGGGGAPAGYDRAVTHIRWSFGGSLTSVSPNNAGSVAFTVRVR